VPVVLWVLAPSNLAVARAQALNRTRQGLSKGVAGITKVKVMRQLLMRVEQQHT